MTKLLTLLLLCTSTCIADFNVGIVPTPLLTYVEILHNDPLTIYTVEYSSDLVNWSEYIEMFGDSGVEMIPGFYRAYTAAP